MRRKFVAGNWKMHGSRIQNEQLMQDLLPAVRGLSCEVVLFPPFVYLEQLAVRSASVGVGLGGQNLSEYPSGAFTGEISAAMLGDLGCRYVLVGHSERRSLFGETDRCVALKFAAALQGGLQPVLCLGETLAERESGQTERVVAAQLQAVVDQVGVAGLASAIIAYEPVWAIGTGVTAQPSEAQAVHAFLRARLRDLDAGLADGVRMIYGGSVKPQNAGELFAQPDIDGGLVGGASLVADDFLAICSAAH